MLKKSFTINPLRKKEEILSYMDCLLAHDCFQGCEIFYPYNQSKSQFEEYTNALLEIKNRIPSVEFLMHLPFGNYEKNNLADIKRSQENVQLFQDSMDYAALFGVKKLTLHAGIAASVEEKQKALPYVIEGVQLLATYARHLNMTLMLENLVREEEFLSSENDIEYFLDVLAPYDVQLTLDFGHAAINKIDIASFIRRFHNRIGHTHIHDNNLIKDEHLRPLLGKIDFHSAFSALREIHYQEFYGLEALYNDYEDLISYSKIIDQIQSEVKK